MNLAAHLLQVVESVDRRVLGAFRFRDVLTELPLVRPVAVQATGAVLVRAAGDILVPLAPDRVRVRQNRSGMHVIIAAPFFAEYTTMFLDPRPPTESEAGPLRIRFVVSDAGPHHLPREFTMDLPRSIDPNDADRVFDPVEVDLFRSPAAPLQDGWARLRLRVVESGASPAVPLPGVLIRAFRSPRVAANPAIGVGMTDWRGSIRGEALLPVTGVERFRPGNGGNLVESELPVVLEAIRALAFTGAQDEHPDPGRLLAAVPPDLADPAPAGFSITRPPAPVNVRAGRETSLELTMN